MSVLNRAPTITSINDADFDVYDVPETQSFTVSDLDALDTLTITLTYRSDGSAVDNPPFTLNLSNYPCKTSSCSVTIDPYSNDYATTHEL